MVKRTLFRGNAALFEVVHSKILGHYLGWHYSGFYCSDFGCLTLKVHSLICVKEGSRSEWIHPSFWASFSQVEHFAPLRHLSFSSDMLAHVAHSSQIRSQSPKINPRQNSGNFIAQHRKCAFGTLQMERRQIAQIALIEVKKFKIFCIFEVHQFWISSKA